MIEPFAALRARHSGFSAPWPHVLIVIAAVGFALVAELIAAGVGSNGDPFAISRAMGGLVAVLLISALIGGVTYKYTRERSLWPGTIVTSLLLVALGLMGAASAAGGRLSWTSPGVWREMDHINTQMLHEVRQAVEGDATSIDIEEIVGRHTAELAKLESRMKGDDAIALQVGIGFTRDAATINATYLTSLRPFMKAGGMKPESFTSRDKIAKRREMAQAALSIQRTGLAAFEKTPQDLRSRAEKLGMSAADAEKMTSAMLDGMRFAKILRIHRLEGQLLEVMDEHMADLEKRFSNWKYKDGQVLFSDISQKSLDAFNQRIQKLQALSSEQQSLQSELFAERRRR